MNRESDVQSIVRVLSVLEVLNQRSVTSIAVMHQVTGIPKPTLVRLLGTLVGAGYVFHVSRRGGYALTERVLRLSAGFHYHDAIVDSARPLLEDFTRRHKWMVSLSTPDTDAMLVRFNTQHISPFAPDTRFLNKRVGMLVSAVGRAYLAYCSDLERETILRFLQASTAEIDACAGDLDCVATVIERVRQKRYATIRRPRENHVRSIAIPVLSAESGGAVASMALFYFSLAMTEPQAAHRFLDELYEIAGKVASGLGDVHESSAVPATKRRA